jgi:hypothetical protein
MVGGVDQFTPVGPVDLEASTVSTNIAKRSVAIPEGTELSFFLLS